MNTTTIAALASPPGLGAVALIRISGGEALSLGQELCRPLPRNLEARYQYFTSCYDQDNQKIDEVLFTWFKSPASFTGETVVEIACHGGQVVSQSLLNRIFELGAQPAEPGEFSQRAFINGKMDLTQAEAIMDLISAKTELAAQAAGQQLAGNLGIAIEELRQELIEISAHVEAYIDFPDEDIDLESRNQIAGRIQNTIERIDALLSTADRGRVLRDGIQTVLCGAPNAGKSSLLNQLVGFDRAIVSNTAGTTRDTIEQTINLKGIPLTIIDTAGIRKSGDEIENLGINRSLEAMERAELVLWVIDSTRPKTDVEAIPIPDQTPTLKILNKSDLPPHDDWKNPDATTVLISCSENLGFKTLQETLYTMLSGDKLELDKSELIAINSRHQHCLLSAKKLVEAGLEQLQNEASPEFVSFELRESLEAIGSVVGKTDVEEILGSIFSTFCIGK